MPLTIMVTKVTETQAVTGGKLGRIIRVEYTVGDHGPFVAEFPLATFNAALARQELERMRDQISQLTR